MRSLITAVVKLTARPSWISVTLQLPSLCLYESQKQKRFFSSKTAVQEKQNVKSPPIRLSKLLSSSAATNLTVSRHEAERLLQTGQVTIAGQIVTNGFFRIQDLANNALKVQGKVVQIQQSSSTFEQPRVWVVHKFNGEIVAEFDPQGRPTLIDRLVRGGVGEHKHHLKPIGRLDASTEGLMLITSCGAYARQMELPVNKLHRTYRIRVHGVLSDYKLERIQKGVTINNVRYGPMKTVLDTSSRSRGTNTWVTVTCVEGKNRQIRNVFQYLGLQITRLIRTSYGDYSLKNIPPGMAIEVPVKPVEQQKKRGVLFPKRIPKTVEKEKLASPVQWVRRHGS
jgi:23S rRNA pseudouridine2605 synthase